MKFSFGVTSIQGLDGIVGINRLIDWTVPHHFTLSLVIENDLSTKLAIALDGETVAKVSLPYPLFVANDPVQYESYQNRSHEDSQAGLDLALIEVAMFGKKLPVKERAQMFLYFENYRIKEDLRCVYFTKGQYGYAAPGTNDMRMTNSPVMWSVGKLLKGEFPKSKDGSV